jgi:hypothetical protein
MDFIGSICIPDDELAVLRSGHKMSSIRRPVHGVDFGQMALKGAPDLHAGAR